MLLRIVASQLAAPAERLGPSPREGQGRSRGEHWSELRLRYPAEGAARGSLLGLGPDVEVLEPASLRAGMLEASRAVAALYQCDKRS